MDLYIIIQAQLSKLEEELSAVRKNHHEQLETAEEAREAAELRAVEIQKQQEQRSEMISIFELASEM